MACSQLHITCAAARFGTSTVIQISRRDSATKGYALSIAEPVPMGTRRGRGGRNVMDLQKRPGKRPQTECLRQQHDNQQGPAKRPRGGATNSRAGSRALSRYSAQTLAASKPRAIVDAFAGQRSMSEGANRISPPEDDQYADEPASGSENLAEDFEDLPGSASVPPLTCRIYLHLCQTALEQYLATRLPRLAYPGAFPKQ